MVVGGKGNSRWMMNRNEDNCGIKMGMGMNERQLE
jgi:hypothetical protein